MFGVLSDLVVENLGDTVADAFFENPIELASVPQNITQYVIDLYNNPAAEDMFDFIVEAASVSGAGFDSGNLFDFSTFDPCYSMDAESASASQTGSAIGAVFLCPRLLSSTSELASIFSEFTFSPNPVNGSAVFEYSIETPSQISLSIYSLDGRLIDMPVSGFNSVGQHQLDWNSQLSSGLYLAVLQTEVGVQSMKFIVK